MLGVRVMRIVFLQNNVNVILPSCFVLELKSFGFVGFNILTSSILILKTMKRRMSNFYKKLLTKIFSPTENFHDFYQK